MMKNLSLVIKMTEQQQIRILASNTFFFKQKCEEKYKSSEFERRQKFQI
jgi:hypothetical protein